MRKAERMELEVVCLGCEQKRPVSSFYDNKRKRRTFCAVCRADGVYRQRAAQARARVAMGTEEPRQAPVAPLAADAHGRNEAIPWETINLGYGCPALSTQALPFGW